MSLKQRIQKEIARGNLGKGIKILLEGTANSNPSIYNQTLALSGRYNSLKRDKSMGIIGFSEGSVATAKITAAILSIIDPLDNHPLPPDDDGADDQADNPTSNNDKLVWDEFLRWLNRILAGHVYEKKDIRNLAASFGLPVISMNWDSNARTHWFNVIDYYVRRDQNGEQKEKLLSIIKYVIDNYGDGPNLQKALQWAMPKVVELELTEKEYNEKVGSDSNFEKLMKEGVNTLLPIWFLETGIKRGKSVGRIETEDQYGTGFLLKNNYLLTNHHVIKSREVAMNAKVQMNYEKHEFGGDKKKKTFTFDVSEAYYFATSEKYDWTIIKLKEAANDEWGYIEIKEIQEIKKDDRVVIIQHPDGGPKQVGLHNNFITYVDKNIIMYLTDTMEGSSGSPVFNQKWELVGLHNQGGYLREPTKMGKVWRNAGININKVLAGIRDNNIPGF